MKFTIERQVPLAFALGIILLLLLGFAAYFNFTSLNTAIGWEIHTEQVLQKLDENLLKIVNAESAVRGYVVTGDDSFLEPYHETKKTYQQNITELSELVADNPRQTARIANLIKLSDTKLEILDSLITARRISRENAAEIVESGQGRVLMMQIHVLIEEMKSQETALLREREDTQQKSFSQAIYLSWLGSAVGIIILLLAAILIMRQINLRRIAENQLLASNQDLEMRVEKRTHQLAETNQNLLTEIEKREEAENRQKIAIEAGRLGIWRYSPESHIYEADARILELSGITPDEFDGTGKSLFQNLHPDDLPHVKQSLNEAVANDSRYFDEFRIIHKDQTTHWIQATAQTQKTADGKTYLIGFSSDFTERREAENKLAEILELEKHARLEAEAANRTRDEFLATVSHELRNPLNAILGWSRLLQRNQVDAASYRKAIDAVVRNAEAQNHLIEDLLDVSRIIAGKLRLEIAPINPAEFVEAAAETVRPAAEAKEVALIVEIEPEINQISGDANRLQQVVWNLLSNAIKFAPKKGVVSVAVKLVNSMIEISVTDDGLGISPEFLPNVFDRFRQADASTVRRFGGLGLGLAIVRHLVEMHGGTVEAASAGENLGSTFTVKLPVSAVSAKTEDVLSKSEVNFSNDAAPAVNLSGLSILTVDDEADTCHLLSQVLSYYGARVRTAQSAVEALAEFKKGQFDVIVSDIGMPDEDGYSLIQKIRALPNGAGKKIPAIALTAFTRPTDRVKTLEAGFQMHVSKPVEPDELAAVIASLTDRLKYKTEEF